MSKVLALWVNQFDDCRIALVDLFLSIVEEVLIGDGINCADGNWGLS